MKKRAMLSAAVMLLALGTPSAASARPASTAPVAVLSTLCTDGYIDNDNIAAGRGPGGKIHGFVKFKYSERCGDQIFYFEGSGRSWRAEPTTLTGKVVDVAVDTAGAFLMYITREADNPPGTSQLKLVLRHTDGQFEVPIPALARITDSQPEDGRGTIAVRNNLWFAVWPQYTGTPGEYTLYENRVMFGDGDPDGGPLHIGNQIATGTNPKLFMEPDPEPSAGLQPRLVWQRDGADGTKDILLSTGNGGLLEAATTVATGVPVSPDFDALDAAGTAAGRFITWTQRTDAGDRAVVADNLAGTWRTSTPPAEDDLGSWDANIEARDRTVFAAYGTGDGSPDGAYMGSKTGNARWFTHDATRGIPRGIDTFGIAGLILDGRDKSTALIYSGHRLYALTR